MNLRCCVRQVLTKNYFAANEQYRRCHARNTPKRGGGVWVGFATGQIKVLHNRLWYNRGIK